MNRNTPLKKNIFIYGYFGWYNAGDDAIGYGVLKELSDMGLPVDITLTGNDRYFERQAKILFPDLSIRMVPLHPLSLLVELLRSEKCIIVGGTHLSDEGELIYKRTKVFVFFYLLTLTANLGNRSPLFLGHGIGPVTKPWNKFLLKRILRNAQRIIVRDTDSFETVTAHGSGGRCLVGFDCSVPFVNALNRRPQEPIDCLGISVLPAFDIYSKKESLDRKMVSSLGAGIRTILADFPAMRVNIFSFRGGNTDSDEGIVSELESLLPMHADRVSIIRYRGEITGFLDKIDECSVFVGMRYHSSLFAYLLAKPLVIVEYMGKCRGLARDIGEEDDYIVSLAEIVSDPKGNILVERLEKMIQLRKSGYRQSLREVLMARERKMFTELKDYLT